jgi:hypothetical protein
MSLDAIPKHQRRGVGALTSLKDEAKTLRDASGRLEEENKQLHDRFGNVQAGVYIHVHVCMLHVHLNE